MQKSILILMILIGANIKGMENEDDEVILGREIAIIKKESPASQIKTFIKNNKEGLIGGTGGLVGGGVFGYGMEKLTEKTNEEGKKIEGWWSRNLTIGFSFLSMGFGASYYGKQKGIEVGKEIGKREAIELLKAKTIKNYRSKIEKIKEDNECADFIKELQIKNLEQLIEETENE